MLAAGGRTALRRAAAANVRALQHVAVVASAPRAAAVSAAPQRRAIHAATAPLTTIGSKSAECTRALSTDTQSIENPEFLILDNALRHISEHGWTIEALAAGATDLGYPSVAHGMFPRGAIELVDYFMDKSNDELHDILVANTEKLQLMSVTDRLKLGVRTRLEMLSPVLSTWPQAMALGALPQNAPTTFAKLAKLSDEIWYFAGDKSTDASWYTKRALLTGIYASTELFMLSDQSPGFQDTWSFLDRRIDETITLGELPQNVGEVAAMAGVAAQSLLSAVTSLAGPVASQILSQSPLANAPNPISALGNVVPPSVVAGFPSNPLASSPVQPPPGFGGQPDFDPKDLHEIDEELEKLGGADAQRRA
ncbi:Rpsu-divergently transcribed protein, partial [Globisporangium splendens]